MLLGYGNTFNQGAKTILLRVTEEGDTLWTKKFLKYGNLGNRGPVDITAAADNSGFFILMWQAISQYGNPVGNTLMKCNNAGDSLWQVAVSEFPDWASANLRSLKATADGGCIIVGTNAWNNASIIKKINAEGGIEWSNQASTDTYPHYANVAIGPDNTYFAVGKASGWRPTGENDKKLSIKKTNAEGTTIWEKIFNSGHAYSGDSIRSEGFDVVALEDGGCIICGSITNKGAFFGPALVMRLNADGDTVWTRKFENTTYAQATAYKIEASTNGNFLIYLDRSSTSAQGRLMKINLSGETIWVQHGYNYWMKMTGKCSDGGIIFTGGHDVYGFFIKSSQDGMHLGPVPKAPWNGQTNLGGPTYFWWDETGAQQLTSKYELQIATDAGFSNIVVNEQNIVNNNINIFNLSSFTNFFWRVRAFGPEGGHGMWSSVFQFTTGEIVGMDESSSSKGFSISQNYPNPAFDFTTIILELEKENETELQISDVTGRVLYTENKRMAAGRHQLQLNISQFSSGLYFYSLKSGNGKVTKTMSVIH